MPKSTANKLKKIKPIVATPKRKDANTECLLLLSYKPSVHIVWSGFRADTEYHGYQFSKDTQIGEKVFTTKTDLAKHWDVRQASEEELVQLLLRTDL